jgi:hypothetical protein
MRYSFHPSAQFELNEAIDYAASPSHTPHHTRKPSVNLDIP